MEVGSRLVAGARGTNAARLAALALGLAYGHRSEALSVLRLRAEAEDPDALRTAGTLVGTVLTAGADLRGRARALLALAADGAVPVSA